MNQNIYKNQGMAALISVLIVGAVALVMVKSLALMGIDELDSMSAYSGGEQARATAESCLEEGLHRLQLDNGYTANAENIAIGPGSCELTVSGTGSNRELSVAAEFDGFYRYYEAAAERLSDRLELNNYNEIIN